MVRTASSALASAMDPGLRRVSGETSARRHMGQGREDPAASRLGTQAAAGVRPAGAASVRRTVINRRVLLLSALVGANGPESSAETLVVMKVPSILRVALACGLMFLPSITGEAQLRNRPAAPSESASGGLAAGPVLATTLVSRIGPALTRERAKSCRPVRFKRPFYCGCTNCTEELAPV